MKDSGSEVWSGAMARWLMPVEIIMKACGPIINVTAKEPCTGWRVMRSTKVTGRITSRVASAHIFGWMEQLIVSFCEIDTLATGNSANAAAKVPFTTQMEASTREAGRKTTSTVKVFLLSKMEQPTTDPSKMIEWSTEPFLKKRLLKLQLNSRLRLHSERKRRRQMEARRQKRQEMPA